jgi:thioredoxin-related protein
MKKTMILLILLVSVFGMRAQTNFRTMSFDEALQAAKKENKQVFVDFHTSWCGPCKRMAREVFPTKPVGDYMNAHFVSLAIDAEKGEGVQLAKEYKVKAYPTMVIIRPDRSEVGRVVGYRDGTQFTNELERLINPKMSAEALTERYMKGERTPELISAYAALVFDEGYNSGELKKYQAARLKSDSIVESYFVKLSDKQRLAPANEFVYTGYTRDVFGPAMQFLIRHLDKMPADYKTVADSVVSKNYHNAVVDALCNGTYSKNKLDSLENDLKTLKLNTEGKYDLALTMARKYAEGNINEYIAFAHDHFTQLPSDMRTAYAESFGDLFRNCDSTTKKRAAWIVRDGLAILPSTTIYFASDQLRQLEGDGYADPVRE